MKYKMKNTVEWLVNTTVTLYIPLLQSKSQLQWLQKLEQSQLWSENHQLELGMKSKGSHNSQHGKKTDTTTTPPDTAHSSGHSADNFVPVCYASHPCSISWLVINHSSAQQLIQGKPWKQKNTVGISCLLFKHFTGETESSKATWYHKAAFLPAERYPRPCGRESI